MWPAPSIASATPVADVIGPTTRRTSTRRLAVGATLVVVASVVACIGGCLGGFRPIGLPAGDTQGSRYTFRLLGQRSIEHALAFGGTVVGGLSGIDRDPATDLYYLVSDDRSHAAPTRFYTARLAIDGAGFHDVALQSVVTLAQPDGSPYPRDAADAEAIRHDPETGDLWWTSEGARKVGRLAANRLIDPFVRRSTATGRYAGEVPLPEPFRIRATDSGPRDNLVFEGLALSTDHGSLWVAMEAPLLQDGPLPTFTAGAFARFSRFERDRHGGGFGRLATQLAYPIDAIPAAGAWTSILGQNGVSEILAVDATHLFVLERAFVVGTGWRVRLFEADIDSGSDVRDLPSLSIADGSRSLFTPMRKQLVLNFDALGIAIDNLEGLCFGPTLPNGHRTLILVSDDNFNPGQTTQLIALELVPR